MNRISYEGNYMAEIIAKYENFKNSDKTIIKEEPKVEVKPAIDYSIYDDKPTPTNAQYQDFKSTCNPIEESSKAAFDEFIRVFKEGPTGITSDELHEWQLKLKYYYYETLKCSLKESEPPKEDIDQLEKNKKVIDNFMNQLKTVTGFDFDMQVGFKDLRLTNIRHPYIYFELDNEPNYTQNKYIEYKYKNRTYDYYTRKNSFEWKVETIWTYNKYIKLYSIKLGWIPYLIDKFSSYMSEDTLRRLGEVLAGDLPEIQLEGLYESQLRDVNKLIKSKRGIFQCYTGYGKTQVIATLAYYAAFKLNQKVVIFTPNYSAYTELSDRLKSLYSFKTEYFNPDSNLNLIACSGYLKSKQFNPLDEYWKKVDWVISDEVEYTLTTTSMRVYDAMGNAKYWYGFSATADKRSGSEISPTLDLVPSLYDNYELIGYFSFMQVYNRPTEHRLNMINVHSDQFKGVNPVNIIKDDLAKTLFGIYTTERVCNLMKAICKKEGPTLIPINRLELIDFWISKVFNEPDMMVLNICGRGNELYIGGEFMENISLEEVKTIIKDEKATAILGTASVYRALDFKGLHNIMPLTSHIAGITIQSIGRIARDVDFNVISLISSINLGVYTADSIKRSKLISDYYSQSSITKIRKHDLDYGIM